MGRALSWGRGGAVAGENGSGRPSPGRHGRRAAGPRRAGFARGIWWRRWRSRRAPAPRRTAARTRSRSGSSRASRRRRSPRRGGEAARLRRGADGAKALAVAHADGTRWIVVGLGAREDFDHERARVAAALVAERARELSARALCWQPPAEGRGGRGRTRRGHGAARLPLRAQQVRHDGGPRRRSHAARTPDRDVRGGLAERDRAGGAGRRTPSTRARDLQNRPANDLTPTALADHAPALAAEIDGLSASVEGRERDRSRAVWAPSPRWRRAPRRSRP